MAIDSRGLYKPEQMPSTPWVDFGEDQPIDISPAVGAFQKRFMQGPRPPATSAPTHAGSGDVMLPPEHVNNDIPLGPHENALSAMKKPMGGNSL